MEYYSVNVSATLLFAFNEQQIFTPISAAAGRILLKKKAANVSREFDCLLIKVVVLHLSIFKLICYDAHLRDMRSKAC